MPGTCEPDFVVIGTGEGRVLAARFDPRKGRLLGTPTIMLQDVQQENANGTVQFAVSGTGTVVYQRKSGDDGLVWVDRSGALTPVDTAMHGAFEAVALSPDGTQIALSQTQAGEGQIWIKQLSTGAFSRLPFDAAGSAARPVWTPDGRNVGFLATRNNRRTGWVRRADGSDTARVAAPGSFKADEIAFDPRGRYILFRSEGSGAGTRYLTWSAPGWTPSRSESFSRPSITTPRRSLPMAAGSRTSPRSPAPRRCTCGRSPTRFGADRHLGGRRPGADLEARTGRSSSSATGSERCTQCRSRPAPGLRTARRTGSSPTRAWRSSNYHATYDVHPDGKRFLMITSGGTDAGEFEVIFNWRVELEKLEKATK